MSLLITARGAPKELSPVILWDYLLTLNITRAGVIAALDSFVASEVLTFEQAEKFKIRIEGQAKIYELDDPNMLLMAQLLGIAQTYAELKAHFTAAYLLGEQS